MYHRSAINLLEGETLLGCDTSIRLTDGELGIPSIQNARSVNMAKNHIRLEKRLYLSQGSLSEEHRER